MCIGHSSLLVTLVVSTYFLLLLLKKQVMATYLSKPNEFVVTNGFKENSTYLSEDIRKQTELLPPLAFIASKCPTQPTTQHKNQFISGNFPKNDDGKEKSEILQVDDGKQVLRVLERQASEIGQLKHDLELIKLDTGSVEALPDKRCTPEDKYNDEVLEKDVTYKRLFKHQLDLQAEEYRSQIHNMSLLVEKLQNDLLEEREGNCLSAEALKDQFQSLIRDLHEKISDLENRLRDEQELNCSLSDQLAKLKSYIGNVDPTPDSECRRELDHANTQLVLQIRENEEMQHKITMLNIRLDSIHEIQRIQESFLSQSKAENMDKNDMEELLLSRWREKVFSLLVQQQSSNISMSTIEARLKQKEMEHEQVVEKMQNQYDLIKHQLSDSNAHLSIEKSENQSLQRELLSVQHMALQLDSKLEENSSSSQGLAQSIGRFNENISEVFAKLEKAENMCKSYCQRISFASGRVDICKAQLERKEALVRLKAEGQPLEDSLDEDSLEPQQQHHVDTELVEELKKVMEERDALAAQMKSDWSLFQSRVDEAKRDCQVECKQMIDESKRNCAKAVVELRQLERKTVRERESWINEKLTLHQMYDEQISKLKKDLQKAETDCNVMMTSLRQEGLLSHSKLLPQAPNLSLNPDKQDNTSETPRVNKITEESSALIQDLKILSCAVLHEDPSQH